MLTELTEEDIQELEDSGKKVGRYRIKPAIKQAVVERLVRGLYGGRSLDAQSQTAEDSVVGRLRRNLNLNGSFSPVDTEKVVQKVSAFMTKEQWEEVDAEIRESQGQV
jgi:hypothetical protein